MYGTILLAVRPGWPELVTSLSEEMPEDVFCCAVDIDLAEGTYALLRRDNALTSAREPDGLDLAAVRGVIASLLGAIQHDGVRT